MTLTLKRMNLSQLQWLYISLALTILSTFPLEALARAGGGGGGKGNALVALIFWPILLIYSAIVTYQVNKKNKEAQALLEQLSKADSIWEPRHIQSRVERVFFAVQEAWMERNQDIAKEFISQRLYEKHQMQTDQMIRQNRKNVLERINLISAQVVQTLDFKDDTKDSLVVYIKGSMVDYVEDSLSGKLISGEKDKSGQFSELWTFIRDESMNNWVLDEIDQSVSIGELKGMASKAED